MPASAQRIDYNPSNSRFFPHSSTGYLAVPVRPRVMTFARIGAVVAVRVEDYYPQGRRWWMRLREKGSNRHEMSARSNQGNQYSTPFDQLADKFTDFDSCQPMGLST